MKVRSYKTKTVKLTLDKQLVEKLTTKFGSLNSALDMLVFEHTCQTCSGTGIISYECDVCQGVGLVGHDI